MPEETIEAADAAQETPAPPAVDWQAKYEQAVAQSRKWEERSKANADKAKAYDALAQQQADAQAAADEAKARADKAEADLAGANRQLAVSRIAAEKGVDAEILAAMAGDDAEAIEANADKLAASYRSRSLYPSVADAGAAQAPAVTAESIEAIKDPLARVMARAEHIDLYR